MLKENGHIFDTNMGKIPYKFRLGIHSVFFVQYFGMTDHSYYFYLFDDFLKGYKTVFTFCTYHHIIPPSYLGSEDIIDGWNLGIEGS